MVGLKEWAKGKGMIVLKRVTNAIKPALVMGQYEFINRLDRDEAQIRLMNYGFIDPDPSSPVIPLTPEEEPDRCSLQLYHRVAAAVDLAGKDVLEVGCGRGGGAVYVMKHLGPKSVTGVDLCIGSVRFCREQYPIVGLTFHKANAERLPFADESFDAVVNIESSHCYRNVGRFFAQVRRVLRPGGFFLFADFRSNAEAELLRKDLAASGLNLLEEENINEGVLLALDHEDARKREFIGTKVPERRRAMFEFFAAVKGSGMYEAFRLGQGEYLRFVLRK
jgi:SAM-dependent methyltransferase